MSDKKRCMLPHILAKRVQQHEDDERQQENHTSLFTIADRRQYDGRQSTCDGECMHHHNAAIIYIKRNCHTKTAQTQGTRHRPGSCTFDSRQAQPCKSCTPSRCHTRKKVIISSRDPQVQPHTIQQHERHKRNDTRP